jgi:hypothetical protein
MSTVIIGMDPHKRSATIEVMDSDETVLGRGRYGTVASGYAATVRAVRHWPERTWAIEGCQGIGGHIARRLLADREQVVDVPPKLSARTRMFSAGQGRKTNATDAHAVALAATRMTGPHPLAGDEQLAGIYRTLRPSEAWRFPADGPISAAWQSAGIPVDTGSVIEGDAVVERAAVDDLRAASS